MGVGFVIELSVGLLCVVMGTGNIGGADMLPARAWKREKTA